MPRTWSGESVAWLEKTRSEIKRSKAGRSSGLVAVALSPRRLLSRSVHGRHRPNRPKLDSSLRRARKAQPDSDGAVDGAVDHRARGQGAISELCRTGCGCQGSGGYVTRWRAAEPALTREDGSAGVCLRCKTSALRPLHAACRLSPGCYALTLHAFAGG